MTGSLHFNSRSRGNRTILILRGDSAYWIRLIDDQIEACHHEYINHDTGRSRHERFWITDSDASEPAMVELILDTTLDEVDRISVEQTGHVLVDHYRRIVTMKRLRRDYAKAEVYALPSSIPECTAAVMHLIIPAHWETWLLDCQLNNIVFHQAMTGSQLAAQWSRKTQELALVRMRTGEYERHILVQYGAIVFLRTLSLRSESKSRLHSVNTLSTRTEETTYLQDTIDHLINSDLIPGERIAQLFSDAKTSTNLPGLDQSCRECSTILSMLMDLSASSKPECQIQTLAGMRFSHAIARLTSSVGKTNTSVRSQLLYTACRWSVALQPSYSQLQLARRISRLFRLSVLLAVIASIAAAASLFNGVAAARLLKEHEDYRDAAAQDSELILNRIETLSKPGHAADSLALADLLSVPSFMTPQGLLDAIASIMTASPRITLDGLAWATVPRDEVYESLAHGISAVAHRRSLVINDTSSILQMELSGHVSGDSLNTQQYAFNEYMANLQSIENVFQSHVLDAPVDSAMSSASDDRSQGFFRVVLHFNR